MAEFDLAGVQHQAVRLGAGCRRSVKVVAEDGMSHGFHVHPQLMRTSRDWIEFDARNRARSVDVDDTIAGQARPAHAVIDFLLRAVGPIDADGELDLSRGSSHPTPLDQGLVALAHTALLEHDTQLALRFGTAPH